MHGLCFGSHLLCKSVVLSRWEEDVWLEAVETMCADYRQLQKCIVNIEITKYLRLVRAIEGVTAVLCSPQSGPIQNSSGMGVSGLCS